MRQGSGGSEFTGRQYPYTAGQQAADTLADMRAAQVAEAARAAAAEAERRQRESDRDRQETRRFWVNTALTTLSLLAAIVAAWAAVVVLQQ